METKGEVVSRKICNNIFLPEKSNKKRSHSVKVITSAQLHSTKPNLSSVLFQILLTLCQIFVMLRISNNGHRWK